VRVLTCVKLILCTVHGMSTTIYRNNIVTWIATLYDNNNNILCNKKNPPCDVDCDYFYYKLLI
jgi:hypothetical protein